MHENHWLHTPLYLVEGKEEFRLPANKRKYSRLHWAVYSGNCKKLQSALIRPDVNVDTQDLAGWSALHLAASLHSSESLSILLEHKADANKRDNYGKTPLHVASQFGRSDNVKILLDHGADIQAKTVSNRTALYAAVIFGKADACRLLLERGAELNDADNDAPSLLKMAIEKDHSEIVDVLVDFGIDVNAPVDDDDGTALIAAIDKGSRQCSATLIKRGADVNRCDARGKIALHTAIYNGWEDVVELILDRGADLEIKDRFGLTALHKLVMSVKMKKSLLRLIHYGADVNAGHGERMTPLGLAVKLDLQALEKVIEILLMYGACFERNDEYAGKIGRTIDRYLLKRRIAGLSARVVGATTARIDKAREFEESCVEELREIRRTVLYDEVKLYDFLAGNLRGLVTFLGRPNVREILGDLLASKRFPLYDNMIEVNFITGNLYAPIFDKANDCLFAACRSELPHCVISKILDYLNVRDMYKLVDAVTTSAIISPLNHAGT